MDYFNRKTKDLIDQQEGGGPAEAGAPIFENNPISFGWQIHDEYLDSGTAADIHFEEPPNGDEHFIFDGNINKFKNGVCRIKTREWREDLNLSEFSGISLQVGRSE